MLEKFRKAKMAEIEALREALDADRLAPAFEGKRADFGNALRSGKNGLPAVIAEYKRSSPSKGLICDSLDAANCARQYEEGGASAISILTEDRWFKGDFSFLDQAAEAVGNRIPILRKDFICDPAQVIATASSRASALLLIVRLTPEVSVLRQLRELAESSGMRCVVEVFNAAEISLARESGAKIIQVNARDLSTLKVNREQCLELVRDARPEPWETWIQASGIESNRHLRDAKDAGFDAVLVGTSLMKDGEPGKALKKLINISPEASNAG